MGNYDNARAEREFRNNPPSTAPGQGGDSDWGDIYEGSSSAEGSGTTAFTGGSDLDVGSLLNGSQQGYQNQPPVTAQDIPMDDTEKFVMALWIGIKAVGKFLVTFIDTITNNTKKDWSILGGRLSLFSAIVIAIGLVLAVVKLAVPTMHTPGELILGGSITLAIGVVLLMSMNDKDSKSKYDSQEEVIPEPTPEPVEDAFLEDDGLFEDEPEEGIFEDGEGEEMGESDWADFLEDSEESVESLPIDQNIDLEQAVDSIREIEPGTQTRQYLFETFTSVLPLISPDYAEMVPVRENSDEFMMFEEYLRDAAYQAGTSEEKIPELLSVSKSRMIIHLVASHPVGIKEEEIAYYVADTYKRDGKEFVPRGREGIYATVDSRVGSFAINIFLCNDVMFSLGDVYRNIKDFVLDPKVVMPLVWGVNEFGEALYYDGSGSDTGNMLIGGQARSGKSWKGQSLIAQMTMFMSPKEINFYFFDTKADRSDYYYLSTVLPHAKGFCSDAMKFDSELKRIIDKESKIRGKLLKEASCNNIKEYNKLNPTNKLPIVYFVIDEMASAMSEMSTKDKNIKANFNNTLKTIITKYPYYGFKVLVFPHRITNDTINKDVSIQIACRSIMGMLNKEELKTSLGIDPKKFQYNLVKTGDMALQTKDIANGIPCYCHAEVLTSSEVDNRKFFDFIAEVWKKLCPNEHSWVVKNTGSLSGGITAKDNTEGKETYNYSMDANPNNGSGIDGLDIDVDDDDDSTESFWDSIS